jgi:putative ABC transport system permease protein
MLPSFKIALRNLLKSRSTTILNILGLTIAFSSVFSVIFWVSNELSYDKHLPDADRIYRLTFETTISGNTTHFARCWEPWVSRVPEVMPQVEQLVRLAPFRHTAVKNGENKFYSEQVFATDSNFFDVFGMDLISGKLDEVLNKPKSAVLSESIAKKCFGNQNPIGQTLFITGEYDEKQTNQFTVTGVMKDSPKNSHIHFDIVTSFDNPKEAPTWAYVYLLLKKGTKPEDILKQFPAFINDSEKADTQKNYRTFLQRITDIHLYSNKDREIEQNGNITRIYLFLAIAVALLSVSLINYFNLNKARLYALQRQIRIQRIAGSGKRTVIIQSLIESIICVITALFISLNLVDLLPRLNVFNSSSNTLIFHISAWVLYSVILISSIVVLTGSLPVILHMIKNDKLLISTVNIKAPWISGITSYGILITIQFCLSIVLLIATLTIFFQKEFIFSTTMGKMSNDILVFKKQNWEIRGKYTAFKSEALKSPLIKSVSATMDEPGGETMDAFQVDSPDVDDTHKDNPIYVLPVDDNFIDFFNLTLISGRTFTPYNPDRKGEDYILNEAALKKLGWSAEEAIGRRFNLKFSEPGIFNGGTVVGVVRDFTYTSVKQQIKPYVFFQKPIFYLTFIVRIDSSKSQEAISVLRNIWDKELPGYPFQYELLSDSYSNVYQKEISQSDLTALFSVLSMVIICIGLFSISSLFVAQRTKEIGVRRVNGARVSEILMMLNTGFIRWLIIGFVIACPVAYYVINKWLQAFAYKTEIRIWVFIISGLLVAFVTLLTVTLQSLKTARKNPVEALRYE